VAYGHDAGGTGWPSGARNRHLVARKFAMGTLLEVTFPTLYSKPRCEIPCKGGTAAAVMSKAIAKGLSLLDKRPSWFIDRFTYKVTGVTTYDRHRGG
jgi:hypothetical protein